MMTDFLKALPLLVLVACLLLRLVHYQKKWSERVSEFNQAMNFPIPQIGAWRTDERRSEKQEERYKLIIEEVEELRASIAREDMNGYLDALTDIIYATIGGAIELGLDIDKAFERVHASNMTKLDDNGNPTFKENGKLAHGPNFKPPFLEDCM